MFLAFALLACRLAAMEPVQPSVLLITLDTTRADHLSAYAPGHADTPALAHLAAEGMRFDRAYTVAPLTIVSHSSILTGLYPPSHGVRDNGDFVLGPASVTLAERFSAAGYRTAAFTAALPTQATWGLGQGFEVFHDPLEDLPDHRDWGDRRAADAVIDDALQTLPTLGDDPVFAWVHLFDPHWPRRPPEPYLSSYADPYDAAIAYADAELGRLVAAWDALHPESIVVVTADHGEGMGDGGETTHGYLLHDGTLRVPLILRGHGAMAAAIPAGQVVGDPVGTVDIAPTLLSLTGLQGDPHLPGRDLRIGGSEALYSEALTGQYSLGLAPLVSLTTEAGRLTVGAWTGWYPLENGAISTTPDPRGPPPGLEQALWSLQATMNPTQAPQAEREAQAQLAALGYLAGDPYAQPGQIDPRDVIDVIPLTWAARQALGAGRLEVARLAVARLTAAMPSTRGVRMLQADLAETTGETEAAWEGYAALYIDAPSPTVAVHLGQLSAALGHIDEADAWYTEALRDQPSDARAMAGLVWAAWVQGQTERAMALADAFLQTYPDHAEVAAVRAEGLLALGQLTDAQDEADRVLAAMPMDAAALQLAARIH